MGITCRSVSFFWLCNFLASAGAQIKSAALQLALFDVQQMSAYELNCLASLKRAAPDTPIVSLVGFPRIDDVERLKSAGAAAIVSKPFFNDDLEWQIEHFVGAQRVIT